MSTPEHIDDDKGIIHPVGDNSEEEDRCIYFRVENDEEMYWYVIRSDGKTPQEVYLKPILGKNKTDQNFSAVAAVGSVIYVFGGGDRMQFDDDTLEYYDSTVKSVYYIDTNRPQTGWLQAPSMKHRRTRFSAFPNNERKEIYVFRGRSKIWDAEVYNLQTRTWRHLTEDPKAIEIPLLTCHAVVDGGKKLLLFSRSDDQLFSYDVKRNSYGVVREQIFGDEFVNTIAMSDNVLYLAGYNLPSCIMALELNKLASNAKPKKIFGLEERTGELLPPRTRLYATLLHVVEIGKNRLALLWGLHSLGVDYDVHCVKLSISKGVDRAGKTTFTAHSITKSIHYVKGYFFDDQVLAVATSFWNGKDPESMKLDNDKDPEEMELKDEESQEMELKDEEPQEMKLNCGKTKSKSKSKTKTKSKHHLFKY